MKYLLLTVALVAATFGSVFADRPTKAENDAAMKTGRKQFAAKTIELESSLKSHNTLAIKSTTADVLDLMRKGMQQTSTAINFQTPEQQKLSFVHYNKIEMIVHEYTMLSKEPKPNAQQLVDHAHSFLKEY